MPITDYLNLQTTSAAITGFFGFTGTRAALKSDEHVYSNLLALALAAAGTYMSGGDASDMLYAGPIMVGIREVVANVIPDHYKTHISLGAGAASASLGYGAAASVGAVDGPETAYTTPVPGAGGQVVM